MRVAAGELAVLKVDSMINRFTYYINNRQSYLADEHGSDGAAGLLAVLVDAALRLGHVRRVADHAVVDGEALRRRGAAARVRVALAVDDFQGWDGRGGGRGGRRWRWSAAGWAGRGCEGHRGRGERRTSALVESLGEIMA